MRAFTALTSRYVRMPLDEVDTDQIIPARFLKVTERTGLGASLFADWRYAPDGTPRPEFPLNQAAASGAELLLVGRNFGCGSSREHAPWALGGFGFRAILGTSFADIFRQNALKNGLLPIVVDAPTHAALLAAPADAAVTVDLANRTLVLPDGARVTFPIERFDQLCLLEGTDELGYLLSFEAKIAQFEANRR
jgi:3-isopropylmalate/(R)-2-methylmalate dehydratase small subunit